MSSDKTTNSGISIVTIIQIIFACCYYLDPCHTDSKRDCATIIPHWKEWEVWLPSIITAGILVLSLFIGCCSVCLCGDNNDNNKDKDKEVFRKRFDELNNP